MGLVSNSNTGKVEYLIDLEGGGVKQSTLLSITTAPSGTFEKGSQYYNSNAKLIYTAIEDNTWDGAKTSDPKFGTIYIYDNQGTTEYYQWDGDNLVGTDLEKYQLVSNISQDYEEDSETKYPSSKALSDGLNSLKIFPTIVTDSGSSLPSASGYQEGDTFLNSTTKKIYQTEMVITGYQLNTNVTNTATIDLQTGIVNGFVAASGSNKKSIINMNTNFLWKDDVLLKIHFKLNSYNDYMVLLNSHTGGYNNKDIVLYLKDRKLYYSYMYGNPGPINTYTFFTLANYQLSTNIEYFIKINKNGTNITTSIFTQGYDINKEYEETIANIEDWYIEGVNSSRIEYGVYSNGPLESRYSPGAFDGDIYLADSTGDFLIPTGSISWDNGIDLSNKTEYADKTNGILYLYENSKLVKVPKPSNLSFTNVSASNWVVDNTYADYAYKCDLSCSGVKANMFAQVIFAPTEADSGNYATVCQTGNGIVTIYSKVNDTITIPSIVVMGV